MNKTTSETFVVYTAAAEEYVITQNKKGGESVKWSWRNDSLSSEEVAYATDYSSITRPVEYIMHSQEKFKQLIRFETAKVIESGYDGDVENKILDEVLASKIKLAIRVDTDENGVSSVNCFTLDAFEEHENTYDLLEDNKKMNEKLQKIHVVYSYNRSRFDFESAPRLISVEVRYAYSVYRASITLDFIRKTIRNILKQDYTYCIRKRRNVVPKEYLKNGKFGIIEWQKTKQAQNKNCSLERAMVGEALRKQKDALYEYNRKLMSEISRYEEGTSYMPNLQIDGRFNRSLCGKLQTYLLRGKSRQEILEMQPEELLNCAKKHWRSQLEELIKRVDEFTLEDVE